MSKIYLRSLTILEDKVPNHITYPFSIPALKKLKEIYFRSNVTFFVGENGTGKSTFLEAIAYQCGFNTAGGSRNNNYDVDSSCAALGDHIKLIWSPKISSGFFLRAETFYNFASYLDRLAEDDPENTYKYYGNRSLHKQSHGESFLALFTNRFGKKGIYFLDEPEAALSPTRQLSFLRIIRELGKEAQFIIATHSPIIMAYPGAQILNFDTSPITEINYEDTSNYLIIKGFLEHRELYLQKLFDFHETDDMHKKHK